ncbi:hypothetical protein Bca101_096595 [Brassica carinata]
MKLSTMAMELNHNNFHFLSYVLGCLPSDGHPPPSKSHLDVLDSMTNAIADVAKSRTVLRTLGRRPDHKASGRFADIDASLSELLENIALCERQGCRRERA